MTGAAPASGGRRTDVHGEAPVETAPDDSAAAPRATVPANRQVRQPGSSSGRRRLHEPVVGTPTGGHATLPEPVQRDHGAGHEGHTGSVVSPSGGEVPRPEVAIPAENGDEPRTAQPTVPVTRAQKSEVLPSTRPESAAFHPEQERHLEAPTLTRMSLGDALNNRGRAAQSTHEDSPEAPHTPEAPTSSAKKPHGLYLLVKEIFVVVTLALVLALVAKTWVMQTFEIPSDSMLTTLQQKDRVTVSKIMVGPLDIHRGDVVVFEDPAKWLRGVNKTPKHSGPLGETFSAVMTWIGLMPNDAGNHVIKRVIGMPGDKVECCDDKGRLIVNGTPIDEPYVYPGKKPSEERFSIVVPAGKVWVMGDNRNNSLDSRYNDQRFQFEGMTHSNGQRLSGNQKPEGYKPDPQDSTGYFGAVPLSKVVGKAVVMVWPLDRLGPLGGAGDTFAHVPPADPTATPGPIPGVSPSSPAARPPRAEPSASEDPEQTSPEPAASASP